MLSYVSPAALVHEEQAAGRRAGGARWPARRSRHDQYLARPEAGLTAPVSTGRQSPRAVPAGPGGVARRRAQLEARWRDRLERVTALSLAYHDAGELAGQGRIGVTESRRARMLARQAVAERQALAEIEAALDRIASGRYGWCEQCGRPVAAAVLAARPEARYCAACGRHRSAQRLACA